MRVSRLPLILLAVLIGSLTAARTASAAPPEKLRFNQHIRPLLSDRCFYCHGFDDKNRQADLRLDTRDGAIRDLGGYAAIVPGKPDASRLLARVASHNPDEVMPPPKSKKPLLTPEEVARLRLWIEQGAEYEGHWSLLPLSPEGPPEVKQTNWVRNPIDRFVLARLEKERIEPSPPADRATLLRRVALDLTGLPPSADELAAWAANDSPTAYEDWVNRLLASPHYGERWGRHWLDQARYADSNGYSVDGEREMWPYRDWVIKALNDDLPFDRFSIEQLAGDLLPQPTKNQRIATAFHRNTLINQEGGVDREQFRVESLIDRVNTTGAVWLGLTIGCAQCHSHKFDPIAQREYYQLFAYFNATEDANDRGPVVEVARGEVFGVPGSSESERAAAVTAEQARRAAERQVAWEAAERRRLERVVDPAAPVDATWLPVSVRAAKTASGVELQRLDDGSLLAPASVAAQDTYHVTWELPAGLTRVAAVRLRTLTHESLPKQGPGRASNGNFVLSEFHLLAAGKPLSIASATADHSQPNYPVAAAIDGDPKTGWAINVAPGSNARLNADHAANFVLDQPLEGGAGVSYEARLWHQLNEGYQIGRFALEVAAVAPRSFSEADEQLLVALRVAAADRGEAQKKLVAAAWERTQEAGRKREKEQEKNARGEVANVMVMRDMTQARQTYLLTRGDFTRPNKELGALPTGVPQAVSPALPSTTAANRLALAEWLVHPDNPLTPRVTVNRVWMHYFGRGLVETEEDFGTQGAPPSHPELLDWLARNLIQRGWSMKQLHRLIVTSATYRQSSKARPDLAERDPRNLLLARQERLRFEAEVVRDAALVASGLLDRTVGGPSVRPPQPEGVYAFTQTAKSWNAATGGNRYRRGLYTFFYRSAPYPLLTTFDAPDFQTVCTRRLRSNTPLQSLTLANDVAFLELAQAFAAHLQRDQPTDGGGDLWPAWIERGFELALARAPTPRERTVLESFARRQQAAFAQDLASGKALLPGGTTVRDTDVPAAATLVCVARAILNSDNFITRE